MTAAGIRFTGPNVAGHGAETGPTIGDRALFTVLS